MYCGLDVRLAIMLSVLFENMKIPEIQLVGFCLTIEMDLIAFDCFFSNCIYKFDSLIVKLADKNRKHRERSLKQFLDPLPPG